LRSPMRSSKCALSSSSQLHQIGRLGTVRASHSTPQIVSPESGELEHSHAA
jgi:hypothetical protein